MAVIFMCIYIYQMSEHIVGGGLTLAVSYSRLLQVRGRVQNFPA